MLLIKRFTGANQFGTGFSILSWGAAVAVFLSGSHCLSQAAIRRGQGCGTLPSSEPLGCGQGWGAQLRAGPQAGMAAQREEGREVGKKSRLRAENLVGGGEEQTLDQFL